MPQARGRCCYRPFLALVHSPAPAFTAPSLATFELLVFFTTLRRRAARDAARLPAPALAAPHPGSPAS